jgi:hypothetical protein
VPHITSLLLLVLLTAQVLAPSAAGATSPGSVSFLNAMFTSNPIPADGAASSTLRVDVLRIDGAAADDGVIVTLIRDDDSGPVCAIEGHGTVQRPSSNGHVEFDIESTTVAGVCRVTASANGAVGAEARLVTRAAGSPTRLTVSGNNSPKQVGGDTPVTIAVDIDDVYVNLVGDDLSPVTVYLDRPTCSGSPGGDVFAAATTVIASAGRAWFSLRSTGAYAGCAVTFSAPGVRSATTTVSFAHGPADHLACGSGSTILAAGGSMANVSTELRDEYGNPVDGGSAAYTVSFTRVAGSSTEMVTDADRAMLLGAAFFAVRSLSAAGIDEYVASISSSSPSALPGTQVHCRVEVRGP